MATRRLLTTTIRRLTTAPTTSNFSHLRTLSAMSNLTLPTLPPSSRRLFSTDQAQNSNNNPNSSKKPESKEIVLPEGCDYEHWLVVMEPPPKDWTRDQIIDNYVKTLASVVGSEDEARRNIYSVSTKHYFAFGALVSDEEVTLKLKENEKILWVLPDAYLDVKNKDYGGEPFIDGQAVPYDPKYHEEWVKNNPKGATRNNRNDRPRNDSSMNFEGRPITERFKYTSGAPKQLGPPMNAGDRQNILPNNAGYQQQKMPRKDADYQQKMLPNNASYQPNATPSNADHQPNLPPNNADQSQNIPERDAPQ